MSDRIDEFRHDWVGGPVVKKKKRTIRLPLIPVDLPANLLSGFLLLALLAGGISAWMHWKTIDRYARDFLCTVKTKAELAVGARMIRQYYAANGRLPADSSAFLHTVLKKNKPYPNECDHWGTPYRIEPLFEGCQIRSAGPDRHYETRDDLLFLVTLQEEH